MQQIPTTVKATLLVLVTLTIGILPTLSRAGEIMCWKNDAGVRECGNSVPPEYSQERIEVLNDRGLVVRVIQPPKSQAQLQKEKEQEQARKQEAAAKKEQERKDNILLNSYATERDLIMARDTNVKAASAELDIAKGNLKMQENTLDDLQNKAGNYERSGKQPPKKLIDNINATKQQIANKQKIIAQRQKSINQLKQRFDKDLARYRKLKGLNH